MPKSQSLARIDNWEGAIRAAATLYNKRSSVDELRWATEKEHILGIVERSADLKNAIPATLHRAILQAASMGLSFNPIRQECYLMTRKSKRNPKPDEKVYDIAYPYPGYRGLVRICGDTQMVVQIRAEVVFAADKFRYYGPITKPMHEPTLTQTTREQKNVIGAYAICEYVNGSVAVEFVDRKTLDYIRNMSERPNSVMYKELFTEGYKKIAIRRLTKTVGITSARLDAAQAVMAEHEDVIEHEHGETIDHATQQPEAQPEQDAPITTEHLATLRANIDAVGLDVQKVCDAYGIESLDKLPERLYEPALQRVSAYGEKRA